METDFNILSPKENVANKSILTLVSWLDSHDKYVGSWGPDGLICVNSIKISNKKCFYYAQKNKTKI